MINFRTKLNYVGLITLNTIKVNEISVVFINLTRN